MGDLDSELDEEVLCLFFFGVSFGGVWLKIVVLYEGWEVIVKFSCFDDWFDVLMVEYVILCLVY